MQPHELLRAAADVIRATGWSQGSHARDHMGREIGLYAIGTEGTSRAAINPHAASFSIYGAIVKALNEAGSAVPQSGLMWDTLHRLATAKVASALGGTNHLHPIILFNEEMDRTKEEVLAFLEEAAVELEAKAGAPA